MSYNCKDYSNLNLTESYVTERLANENQIHIQNVNQSQFTEDPLIPIKVESYLGVTQNI